MAYDPKDPADKKIVADLVAAALLEAGEEHESATEGLRAKNTELLGKLKKAREGKDGDPETVTQLEQSLEKANADLKLANKALKTVTSERDGFKSASENEASYSKRALIDGALSHELNAVGVKKEFTPAVQKLLAEKVEQTIDGDKRSATVAGKPLSEFVKAWSQSDEGKVYVQSLANGGGDGKGGKAAVSGKQMPRSAFEATSPAAKASFMAEGGTLIEG